jgi:transposase
LGQNQYACPELAEGAPTYGRARRGQRVRAKVPCGRWETTTFIAGLRQDSIISPFVIKGPIDGARFLAYVTQVLIPELRPGDIIVLDNLSSHKNEDVKAAVKAAGAELLFLPPYSPDLNPIELVFSKLKTLLRRAAERTIDPLWNRLGELMDHFPPQECSNFIRHAGYAQTRTENGLEVA